MKPAAAHKSSKVELLAVAAPGLEPIVARESSSLGLPAKIVPGGVTLSATLADIYNLNLWLRTASRVLARVSTFAAAGFKDLERQARLVEWERFVNPGDAVRIRATCHRSRLYHSGAVAERVFEAVCSRVANVRPVAAATSTSEESDQPETEQLIIIRLENDQAQISLDTSGALLHRRGYRLATAKAPLRETLAAALLLAAPWDESMPLMDPLCGSGTIAIEAALLQRRIAPGMHRQFRFMNWPGFDQRQWQSIVDHAHELERPFSGVITASDRDAGAIVAATANADRAGVRNNLSFSCAPLSRVKLAGGGGWVITNPPYGVRIGDERLRNLYAALGNLVRHSPGWHLGMLTSSVALARQLNLPIEEKLATSNGGLRVHLFTA